MKVVHDTYVLQDNWKDEGWDDWGEYNLEQCQKHYDDKTSDSIWHGDNNERKWRIIRRITIEEVME